MSEGPLDLGGGVVMRLVRVKAGRFAMGSPDTDKDADDDEKPQREVEITRDFWMAGTEVTRGQFARFVAETGYKTDAERDGKGGWGWKEGTVYGQDPRFTWRDAGFAQTDDHPVVNVSWNDAAEFGKWLSGKSGREVRLPTEAEWEYACRAGSRTRYATGDDAASLKGHANIADASAKARFPGWTTEEFDDGSVFTAAAGSFPANAFGLKDMVGNVYEWCGDGYDARFYANAAAKDPFNPGGESRVLRGGSWGSEGKACRSANRHRGAPDDRNDITGFRVVAVSR
jgi:formylglycine-generating enzyme required for sulfatase activity